MHLESLRGFSFSSETNFVPEFTGILVSIKPNQTAFFWGPEATIRSRL